MTVTESDREALSALMDGEATDLDLARVLRAVGSDSELRALWARQHRVSTILAGRPALAVDVSAGVRAELEARPAQQAARNPLIGLAVAASVTLAVVFGGQQLLTEPLPGAVPQVSGSVVPVQGAAPVQASFGTTPSAPTRAQTAVSLQAATVSAYEQVARERLLRLGRAHAQSTAALQPNPIVPYARIPQTEP